MRTENIVVSAIAFLCIFYENHEDLSDLKFFNDLFVEKCFHEVEEKFFNENDQPGPKNEVGQNEVGRVGYNEVEHWDDVAVVTEKDMPGIKTILAMVSDFNFENKVGVCLNHGHFKLGENEQVVLHKPKNKNENVLRLRVLPRDDKKHLPYVWKFDEISGNLVPYHFFDSEDPALKKLLQAYEDVILDKKFSSFQDHFLDELKIQNKVSVFGPCLNVMLADLTMGIENDDEGFSSGLIERTDEARREQTMFVVKQTEIKNTLFSKITCCWARMACPSWPAWRACLRPTRIQPCKTALWISPQLATAGQPMGCG